MYGRVLKTILRMVGIYLLKKGLSLIVVLV